MDSKAKTYIFLTFSKTSKIVSMLEDGKVRLYKPSVSRVVFGGVLYFQCAYNTVTIYKR